MDEIILKNLETTRAKRRLQRARLYGRVNPPGFLLEGESYDVDLGVPSFRVVWSFLWLPDH